MFLMLQMLQEEGVSSSQLNYVSKNSARCSERKYWSILTSTIHGTNTGVEQLPYYQLRS
jgi:hypothetical protein